MEKKDSTNVIFVKPCSKVRNKKVTTDVDYRKKIRNGEKIIAKFVNYRFLGVKAPYICEITIYNFTSLRRILLVIFVILR